jgi:hypothetical protein
VSDRSPEPWTDRRVWAAMVMCRAVDGRPEHAAVDTRWVSEVETRVVGGTNRADALYGLVVPGVRTTTRSDGALAYGEVLEWGMVQYARLNRSNQTYWVTRSDIGPR